MLFLRYFLSLKDRGKSHHLEKNTVIIKAIIPFLIVLYCLDLVSHKDLCLSFQGLQIHKYHTLLIPSKSLSGYFWKALKYLSQAIRGIPFFGTEIKFRAVGATICQTAQCATGNLQN